MKKTPNKTLAEWEIRNLIIIALTSNKTRPSVYVDWSELLYSEKTGRGVVWLLVDDDGGVRLRTWEEREPHEIEAVGELHRNIEGVFNYRGFRFAVTRREVLDDILVDRVRCIIGAVYDLVIPPGQTLPSDEDFDSRRQSLADYWKSSAALADEEPTAFKNFRDLARNWNN